MTGSYRINSDRGNVPKTNNSPALFGLTEGEVGLKGAGVSRTGTLDNPSRNQRVPGRYQILDRASSVAWKKMFPSVRLQAPQHVESKVGESERNGRSLVPLSVASHVFGVNPLSIQADGLWTEGNSEPDNAWDTVWHTRAELTPWGYVVWMDLPTLGSPQRKRIPEAGSNSGSTSTGGGLVLADSNSARVRIAAGPPEKRRGGWVRRPGKTCGRRPGARRPGRVRGPCNGHPCPLVWKSTRVHGRGRACHLMLETGNQGLETRNEEPHPQPT